MARVGQKLESAILHSFNAALSLIDGLINFSLARSDKRSPVDHKSINIVFEEYMILTKLRPQCLAFSGFCVENGSSSSIFIKSELPWL